MDKILETEVQRCTVHVYNVLYVVLSYFRKYNNVVRKYNLVVLPEVFYFRGTFVLSYFRTSGSTEVLSYFGSTSVRALYGNRYESTFEGTSGIDTAT